MSIEWDDVSELRSLMSLLPPPPAGGLYEFGEPQWNYIDRESTEELGEKSVECHLQLVNHTFHVDWQGREPEPPRREAGD
jgi:hypothetical protein